MVTGYAKVPENEPTLQPPTALNCFILMPHGSYQAPQIKPWGLFPANTLRQTDCSFSPHYQAQGPIKQPAGEGS